MKEAGDNVAPQIKRHWVVCLLLIIAKGLGVTVALVVAVVAGNIVVEELEDDNEEKRIAEYRRKDIPTNDRYFFVLGEEVEVKLSYGDSGDNDGSISRSLRGDVAHIGEHGVTLENVDYLGAKQVTKFVNWDAIVTIRSLYR